MIITNTYGLLKTKYKDLIEKLEISEVLLGVHLSAVMLSDGSYGVAGTLTDSRLHPEKKERDFSAFTPSRIRGQKVIDLFETTKKSATIDSLKIAVLNAISAKTLSNSTYKILEDTDPIDLINLDSQCTITIVGGFRGYIQKIAATRNKLHVLEIDEDVLSEEHKKFYVPAAQYESILPASDIVIITGLTLVNNSIDGLLSSILPGTQVIVTGPSSSIIPDILFENKVNIIGATRIVKPELLFPIVGEGGTGFHLFRYCAQKICVLNE